MVPLQRIPRSISTLLQPTISKVYWWKVGIKVGKLGVVRGVNAEKWATLRVNTHLVNEGSFIGAGNVLDRNGEILAKTLKGERVYNDSEDIRRSTLHIVGDSEGYIASGVQTAYKRELVGYNRITGIYALKKYERGNDVTLTIDSEVSAVALDALGN